MFSEAKGIIHPYYAVALAPAVGGVVGLGAVALWRARGTLTARLGLAVALFATVEWTVHLLDRSPGWQTWLRPTVVGLGVVALLGLLLGGPLPRAGRAALVAVGLVAALAAPATAAVATAAVPHTGSLPSASPVVQGAGPGGGPAPGRGGFPGRAFPGGQAGFAGGPGGRGGALGGLLEARTVDPALVTALQADAGRYSWSAAAVGSNSAAGPQLASGEPVMAIGGFNGTDPSPTLAAFQQLVAQGEIHYFLGGGGRGPGGGTSGASSQITAWVEAHFTARTIGGTTVYDLTAPTG